MASSVSSGEISDDYYFEDPRDDCSEEPYEFQTVLDEDPESFRYTLVSEIEVQEIFQKSITQVLAQLPGIRTDLIKLLLVRSHWDVESAIQNFMHYIRVPDSPVPSSSKQVYPKDFGGNACCPVCFQNFPVDLLDGYDCEHLFCRDCWNTYLTDYVEQGHGFDIPCMGYKCKSTLGEHFVLTHLQNTDVCAKFRDQLFRDCLESHPNLTRCPMKTCDQLFFSEESFSSKKVVCTKCQSSFCFSCGGDYHLPCDCQTMRRWWKKSFEDSATMTYLSSHTKDCPNEACQRSIEKNGGCNHMRCFQCSHEFCWVCLGDWKHHTKDYYECNKFSEKKADALSENALKVAPHLVTATGSEGRRALVKYLFHYERWKNHAHSLQLEEKFMKDVANRVEKQVKTRVGSFIDWQFLLDAGKLLLKCRRALQYTYALAYYMEEGSKRQLFEHLQAELESEIENISYAIEKDQNLDIPKLQAQMVSAEFRRRALFRDAKSFDTSVVNQNNISKSV